MTVRRLIGYALIDAALWQESFADCQPQGSAERKAATERAWLYRNEAAKRGFRERVITGVSVDIRDLSRPSGEGEKAE